jgi:hypothetical protein
VSVNLNDYAGQRVRLAFHHLVNPPFSDAGWYIDNVELVGGGPSPGITVTETGVDTRVSESRSTDTFSVVLDARPRSNVVLDLSVTDAGEATVDRSRITFTPTNWNDPNWNDPRTVTVRGVDRDVVSGQTYHYWIKAIAGSEASHFSSPDCGFAAVIVSLTTPDSKASEPNNHGRFEITRSGNTDLPATVHFAVSGTATRNSDYRLIVDGAIIYSSEVVMPTGESSVGVELHVLDDGDDEPNEHAKLTLKASSDYGLGASKSGTVTILDDDQASAPTQIVRGASDVLFVTSGSSFQFATQYTTSDVDPTCPFSALLPVTRCRCMSTTIPAPPMRIQPAWGYAFTSIPPCSSSTN